MEAGQRQLFCHLDSINRSGKDASGIAGPFSSWIQPWGVETLQGCVVSGDAHGRRGAGLNPGEQGPIHGKARQPLGELRQGFTDRCDHEGRQAAFQASVVHPWQIGRGHSRARFGCAATLAGAASEEIAHPLAGRPIGTAACGEGLLFPMALKGHTR